MWYAESIGVDFYFSTFIVQTVRDSCRPLPRFNPQSSDATKLASRGDYSQMAYICICPLCQNVTFSTKPKVHNVLHWCQSRAEPRPQVTSKENFLKFGHIVFETCVRTDRQTDRRIDRQTYGHKDRNTSQPSRGEEITITHQ